MGFGFPIDRNCQSLFPCLPLEVYARTFGIFSKILKQRYGCNYYLPCKSWHERAGELSRAAVLQKYEGVPLEKGFGTIVAERVADVAMLLVFIILAFFAQYELIKTCCYPNFLRIRL